MISYFTYQYFTNSWWTFKKAKLEKDYSNISGQIIKKGCVVFILEKMEKQRHNKPLHKGKFHIVDTLGNQIYGVLYQDLTLINRKVKNIVLCAN